jgi:hypothetical protein
VTTVRRSQKAGNDAVFLDEDEIARRLNQKSVDWAAKAPILEREGFPKRDPIMGGRYWPAVLTFWNRRYGLSTVSPSTDGQENLNAL